MKLKDFLNEIRKRAEKDKGICADFEAQETWHNKNISIDEKYDVEYVGKKGQKCPSCRSPISIDEFKDEKSRREFKISGFCQNCQNEIWGEPKGEFQEEEIGDDDVISVGETVNFIL